MYYAGSRKQAAAAARQPINRFVLSEVRIIMIEVRNVHKRFGPTTALDGISMHLERGAIIGFLGPNGAGKSTAMRIITGYLAPDEGEVLVDGHLVAEDPLPVRSRIGYMPETVPLYSDMRVHEYLDFVGRARGLSGAALSHRLTWVTEACGIETVYKQTIHKLSKGYRQRTGLAQALIHDPEILILDEPTSGLDPLQIIGIRDLIRDLSRSKTILFSTHILQEVQPVTDSVTIINHGRIIASGLIDELKRSAMGSRRVYLSLAEAPPDAAQTLEAVDGVQTAIKADESGRFELRGDFDTDFIPALSALVRERQWNITELHDSPFNLEDTFIALTREGNDAGGEVSA